jgi:hypothetical protein
VAAPWTAPINPPEVAHVTVHAAPGVLVIPVAGAAALVSPVAGAVGVVGAAYNPPPSWVGGRCHRSYPRPNHAPYGLVEVARAVGTVEVVGSAGNYLPVGAAGVAETAGAAEIGETAGVAGTHGGTQTLVIYHRDVRNVQTTVTVAVSEALGHLGLPAAVEPALAEVAGVAETPEETRFLVMCYRGVENVPPTVTVEVPEALGGLGLSAAVEPVLTEVAGVAETPEEARILALCYRDVENVPTTVIAGGPEAVGALESSVVAGHAVAGAVETVETDERVAAEGAEAAEFAGSVETTAIAGIAEAAAVRGFAGGKETTTLYPDCVPIAAASKSAGTWATMEAVLQSGMAQRETDPAHSRSVRMTCWWSDVRVRASRMLIDW